MGRRILNRKEMRADSDAAERRKGEEEEETTDEDEESDDEDDEDEEEGGDEDEEAPEVSDEDDEDAEVRPVKKKKAAKVKEAKPAKVAKPKSRSRAAKIVRMKLMWGVFNNSHQCIASYDYPKRKEAEAHAAKLTGDKKSTHFVQPVKEPIEEKKEKE